MARGETLSLRRRLRSLPLSVFLSTLLLLTPATAVELLNPNALPSCAMSCQTLESAQSGCVPPAAPVSNHATYVSCFCLSSFLSTLYTSADGICDSECADNQSELDQIQTWFKGLCKAYNPALTTTTSAIPTQTSTTSGFTTSGTTAAVPPENTALTLQPGADEETGSSWLHDHWKWIIFLVVLLLASVGLIFLLVWLKKRHRRRRDAQLGKTPVSEAKVIESPMEQHPNASQPQMSTMSGANGSDTVIPAPPQQSKTRSRTTSLRLSTHSVSGSRDNVAGPGRSRPTSISGPPPPIVWGPHQNQAQSMGYGYRDSEVEVPTPASARPLSASLPSRTNSWGPRGPGNNGDYTSMSRKTLPQVEEDDRPHTADGPSPQISENMRRKLSKRQP